MRIVVISGVLVLIAGAAHAQSSPPDGTPPPRSMSVAESAAMSFPQPVRAGDLLRRDILRPVESQEVLGRVREVVRDNGDGRIMVVIDFGGFLGFGTRPLAVPVDAMRLLGQDMQVVAFTPEQLQQFPTFARSGTTPIPNDTIIKVGLAKPSH